MFDILRVSNRLQVARGSRSNRCNWIQAAAAGVSALGSLISGGGSAASAKATKYAADRNYQAQVETNKANADLAAQQNQWNIDQWNRENAYNSPAEQRARFEQAGINPYLALGNISAGNAQSLQSADLANQVAPKYDLDAGALGQAYNNIGQSLSNFSSQLVNIGQYVDSHNVAKAEARLKQSEADLNVADLQTRQIENKARIANMNSGTAKNEAETDFTITNNAMQQRQLDYFNDTYDDRVASIGYDNQLKLAQTNLLNKQAANEEIEYQISQKHLKWIDRDMASQLAERYAHIALMQMQGTLTQAEAEAAFAQGAQTREQTRQLKGLYGSTLQRAQNEATISGINVGVANAQAGSAQAQQKIDEYEAKTYGFHRGVRTVGELVGIYGDYQGGRAAYRNSTRPQRTGSSRTTRYKDKNGKWHTTSVTDDYYY